MVKILMRISATVVPGIAPQWPELAVGGPLLTSPAWLRSMGGRFGDRMVTIVVSRDGAAKLAALATVQSKPAPGEFFDLHHVLVSPAPVLPLTDAARAARAGLASSAPPPERWVPNLVVMLPGYECVPVGSGRHDSGLLDRLADTACRWAQAQNLPTVAFLYTHPEPAGLGTALADHDFTGIPLSLTWALSVPADGGMNDYLAMLPAKRRRETTREIHRLGQAGVSVRQLEPREVLAESTLVAMAALRAQLVRKYRGKADEQREREKLGFLIADVCAGKAQVFAAEADDAMIGFALFCPHGDCWYCLAAGYDYADPRCRFCYFATAFYGAVPAAARAGVRSLAYGQGSGQAKRSRGCAGIPLTGWVRSADPAITAAVRASADITELQPAS
jgi:hypothetical protein